MEKRYESLTLFEFHQQFPDDQACYDHLARLKWPDGFICEQCNHTHYCKGKLERTRQCTKCGYQATPTSGTLFHKVKFSILKAFYIVYFISTNKQGIASTELSRKLGLRQKTCWAFKQKVMKAMASSQQHPMLGKVEVDETVVGQEEEGTKGRQNKDKKLVVVAIEREGKGIGRMYARMIQDGSNESLKPFFEDHIDQDAKITTDEWKGYTPFKADFPNLEQIPSGKKGIHFPDMHRAIMMLKAWLRGTHHSVKHLQGYLDEYCYRFNRHLMKAEIFDNLIGRMVLH
ncbi:MAG: IS1595 family transposase, partial [Cyclobacteriaceae bacterium]